MGKTLLGGEGHQLLGSFRKDRLVAAKLVKDAVDVQSERQCRRLRRLAGPRQRGSALRQRLIRLSKQQKRPGDEALGRQRGDRWASASEVGARPIVGGERLPEMVERAENSARNRRPRPNHMYAISLVSLSFRRSQRTATRPPLDGRRGTPRDCVGTSTHRRGLIELRPLRSLPAQLAGTGIRFTDLRRCPSLGRCWAPASAS